MPDPEAGTCSMPSTRTRNRSRTMGSVAAEPITHQALKSSGTRGCYPAARSALAQARVQHLVQRVPAHRERERHEHDADAWRDQPPPVAGGDRALFEGFEDDAAP